MAHVSQQTRDFVSSFAWDKNRLVVTNLEVLARLRKPHLSPSTALAMSPRNCQARWAAERVAPSVDNPFAPNEVGTFVHSVLEELWNLEPKVRTPKVADQILEELSEDKWSNATFTAQLIDRIEAGELDLKADPVWLRNHWDALAKEAFGGYFDLENPHDVDVHSTELRLSDIEVAGVPFKGFADRIARVKGGLSVDDAKTSKKLPNLRFGDDHGDQIRLYISAVEALLGERPIAGSLLYTRVGKLRQADVSQGACDDTLRRFESSWQTFNKTLDDNSFATSASGLCGYCPLVNLCPVAQREGKTDVKGGAVTLEDVGPMAKIDSGKKRPVAEPGKPKAAKPKTVRQFDPYDQDTRRSSKHPALDKSMGQKGNKFRGTKPWDEKIDGELNPNSYSAQAALGLTQRAYAVLNAAEGIKVNRANLEALTRTFIEITGQIQQELTGGDVVLADNSHTRARGLLFTALEANPIPFGASTDELDSWFETLVRHGKILARVGMRLYSDEDADQRAPYHHFATKEKNEHE